jgi:hypothetical protein
MAEYTYGVIDGWVDGEIDRGIEGGTTPLQEWNNRNRRIPCRESFGKSGLSAINKSRESKLSIVVYDVECRLCVLLNEVSQ